MARRALCYEVNLANSDAATGLSDTITFNTVQMGGAPSRCSRLWRLAAGSGTTTINGGSQVSVNGDGSNLFQVKSGANVYLQGLTLKDGNAQSGSGDPNGGAIDNAGTLTVNLCTFSSNSATGLGGAIYNTGVLTVEGAATFTGNTAPNGGAIANAVRGAVSLAGPVFSGNSASGIDGGALYNEYNDGAMTVADCTLSGNTSGYNGGAIYNDGPMTVTGCTLNGNSGQGNGGAVYNDANGTMTVNTSTFTDNTAPAAGAISAGAP